MNSTGQIKRKSLEKIFGQVLRELRTKRGFSQEEIGFESGYHRTYISLLERGQKSPSLQTIFQLSRALSVKASEIIERVQKEKSLVDKQKERKAKRS